MYILTQNLLKRSEKKSPLRSAENGEAQPYLPYVTPRSLCDYFHSNWCKNVGCGATRPQTHICKQTDKTDRQKPPLFLYRIANKILVKRLIMIKWWFRFTLYIDLMYFPGNHKWKCGQKWTSWFNCPGKHRYSKTIWCKWVQIISELISKLFVRISSKYFYFLFRKEIC